MANIREHNRVLAKNGLENSDICRKIFILLMIILSKTLIKNAKRILASIG